MNLFSPLGALYGGIGRFRNALYDARLFRSYDLGARTISIGNLTTGGTGKTPIVALTAEILAGAGERVCILTRGYGRRDVGERVVVSDGERVLADAERGGDEPVELAKKLLGKAAVVADADRVAAAKWAREAFGITAFVLDDAFQHRRAKRDLDIVCIDASDPWGGGYLLPAGRLREPVSALGRADAAVITRAGTAAAEKAIPERIREIDPAIAIFTAANRSAGRVELADFLEGREAGGGILPGRAYAFCGLGNPRTFVEHVRQTGIEVAGETFFPDHHRYSQSDIRSVEHQARAAGASALATTAKDAVKLGGMEFTLPCYIELLAIEISEADEFRRMVLGV